MEAEHSVSPETVPTNLSLSQKRAQHQFFPDHQLVCLPCGKPLKWEDMVQCEGCGVVVHRTCIGQARQLDCSDSAPLMKRGSVLRIVQAQEQPIVLQEAKAEYSTTLKEACEAELSYQTEGEKLRQMVIELHEKHQQQTQARVEPKRVESDPDNLRDDEVGSAFLGNSRVVYNSGGSATHNPTPRATRNQQRKGMNLNIPARQTPKTPLPPLPTAKTRRQSRNTEGLNLEKKANPTNDSQHAKEEPKRLAHLLSPRPTGPLRLVQNWKTFGHAQNKIPAYQPPRTVSAVDILPRPGPFDHPGVQETLASSDRESIIFTQGDVGLSNFCIDVNRLVLRLQFADKKTKKIRNQRQELITAWKATRDKANELRLQAAELDIECDKHFAEAMGVDSPYSVTEDVLFKLFQLSTTLAAAVSKLKQPPLPPEELVNSLAALTRAVEPLIRLDILETENNRLNSEFKRLSSVNKRLEQQIKEGAKLLEESMAIAKDKRVIRDSAPNLCRILDLAECHIAEGPFLYMVSEFMEEANMLSECQGPWKDFVARHVQRKDDDECLYTLSLRYLEDGKDTNEIKFNHVTGNALYQTVPSIRAASINRLIERLAYDRYSDISFLRCFMLTYRSVLTPFDLLEKLVLRYSITPIPDDKLTGLALLHLKQNSQNIIQLRVLLVIKLWLEEFWSDFDEELLALLKGFLRHTVPRKNHAILRSINETLQKKLEPAPSAGKPVPPRNGAAGYMSRSEGGLPKVKLNLLSVDTSVWAQQLALMDSEIYRSLEAKEFFNQGWSKSDKAIRSPNILHMIQHFNKISKWVTREVLTATDLKERVQTVKKFVRVAEECLKVKNFNGALEVVSGLTNESVYRLKKTWESLSDNVTGTFKELKELMEPHNQQLRKLLNSCTPPCVPYLGVYLTDLTFLDDGNSDYAEAQLVNFNKMRLVAEKINQILQYQTVPFSYTVEPSIRLYIDTTRPMSDEELYELSLKTEPRE